jgi:hypothetical protein
MHDGGVPDEGSGGGTTEPDSAPDAVGEPARTDERTLRTERWRRLESPAAIAAFTAVITLASAWVGSAVSGQAATESARAAVEIAEKDRDDSRASEDREHRTTAYKTFLAAVQAHHAAAAESLALRHAIRTRAPSAARALDELDKLVTSPSYQRTLSAVEAAYAEVYIYGSDEAARTAERIHDVFSDVGSKLGGLAEQVRAEYCAIGGNCPPERVLASERQLDHEIQTFRGHLCRELPAQPRSRC